MENIKVNIPRTKNDYANGNGEGCFVSVSTATFEKYQSDYTGGIFEGILQNDSWYFPDLKAETKITFTMRGKNRPVAFINDLLDVYTPLTDEEFFKLINEMSKSD